MQTEVEEITAVEAEVVEEDTQQVTEFAIIRGATSGHVKVTETSISIAEDTTWEQWREGLKFIRWARSKLAVGLADYIEFGYRRFGKDKVDGTLEQLEFELTLVKTAFAIKSIPRELRYANLDSEHYVELAKAQIPPAKKVRWARIASEQRLTPSQLKFSMLEGEVVDRSAARALNHGVVTVHGIRQSFDVWLKRVGGLEGITAMERDHQEDIYNELEAIANFTNQLEDNLEKAE